MKPDLILANSPYGKAGIDITRYLVENFPDANYAMLNTRSAFKPFYADRLACQFVQIGKYELGTNRRLDWGVEQAILLATNGWTEVVDNRKRRDRQPFDEGNSVGINYMGARMAVQNVGRTSHLVGVNRTPVEYECTNRNRATTLVQVNKSGPYLGAAMDRNTATVTDTKPKETKLRNGYIYVAFDTFEEACECAIDIISWENPTDSHYRCIRWGFVTGLVPHYKVC